MTDNKVDAIQSWLLPLLSKRAQSQAPFMLGLSGVQGSGKSTIVTHLQDALVACGYRTAQLSLDDLYWTFGDQCTLASAGNALWATRGQFGTHDTILADSVFSVLRRNSPGGRLKLPSYDKSRHEGRGDRVSEAYWPEIDLPIDVLIFEGWGVGFEALSELELTEAYEHARATGEGQLSRHDMRDLCAVNDALREYGRAFMGRAHLDALVVLQASETAWVYDWRLQQEHALWIARGTGMTDTEVRAFVDRYYTSYELYLPQTLAGFFTHGGDSENGGGRHRRGAGHQLNLRMDRERRLIAVDII